VKKLHTQVRENGPVCPKVEKPHTQAGENTPCCPDTEKACKCEIECTAGRVIVCGWTSVYV